MALSLFFCVSPTPFHLYTLAAPINLDRRVRARRMTFIGRTYQSRTLIPQPLNEILFWKPLGPKSYYGANRLTYLHQLIRDAYGITSTRQQDYTYYYDELKRDLASPDRWAALIVQAQH